MTRAEGVVGSKGRKGSEMAFGEGREEDKFLLTARLGSGAETVKSIS